MEIYYTIVEQPLRYTGQRGDITLGFDCKDFPALGYIDYESTEKVHRII
jgi:hypothetical protein